MEKRAYGAFEGKRFRPSRLKALLNLSLSRSAILRNKRQPRCSLARSDIVHLLRLGLHQRALLRVERVIQEQNMLDALAMIERYCTLVIERVNTIKEHKECPGELVEAISSLAFASKRTAEYPELRLMREVFTALFGKPFVDAAVELHPGVGVNIKMIEKLCKKPPSMETRTKMLQEIAVENCIDLQWLMQEKSEKQKNDQQVDEDITIVEPPSDFTPSDAHLVTRERSNVEQVEVVSHHTKIAPENHENNLNSGSRTPTPIAQVAEFKNRAMSVRTRR